MGGDVTRNSGFNLVSGGDGVVINIILCDGATLSLPNSTINTAGGGKPNLVIWGQENGTGTLSCLSISNQVTSVTVNGGKLYCGVSNYNCAINGNLIVNGGEVHLTAGFNTCVNGSVTYNGGILDTKKISGSTTLNWSNAATDRVKASEYSGSVTIANGKFFKDASGNYYYGSLTDAQKNAIKNVELQPSPNAHFITVDAAVHGAATAPAVAESGNTVTVTVAPDAGYEAANVKYNGNDAVKADNTHFTFTMPASDVTVTASFQPITYTITYNGVEDATFATSNPASYTVEGEAITLNNPTKTGYTFAGWTGTGLTGATETVTIPTSSTGDRAYTANWTTHTYSVQFNGNGATDGEMSAQSFTYDEQAKALTANAYTRTGYTFTGWNTAADGTGTGYTDEQAVQNLTAENGAAVTLYAQWTANTYTIRFVAGIPVYGEMADQSLTYGQAANLTANTFSTTTGYFVNWNTEADGSGTTYTDGQEVLNLTAENGAVITLYAQWHLSHRFNYDSSIFRCYKVENTNEVYWAYEGETVKVEVTDGTSEYTIFVTGEDGTDITFDTETNTFTMPDQEVYITSTSVKKMAYTTIQLDSFDSWEDVAYLYDASNPTVTPTVTVKDCETILTEGTDYTLEITNNNGSADRMVEATVTVTGKGGYVGTKSVTFHITPFNIANCEIKGTLEAYDDGYGPYYPLCNKVEVWNGEAKLTLDTDYSLDIVYPESGEFELGQTYDAIVKGKGDWGGTKTFQFTFVELHHTIVFDANGGTGTMADDTATKGQHYDLPACGFTAPEGKKFDHWIASCEPDAEKQPGNYFTAPYIRSESDVQTITVTAYWRDKVQYTVTASELEHGSLLVNGVAVTLTEGAVTVYEDDTVAVVPQEGYALDTLTVTDANNQNVTVTNDSFTMPESNVTVTATFTEAAETSSVRVVGASLTLEGQIGLNFDLRIPEEILSGEGNRVEFTFKGNTSFLSLAGKSPLAGYTDVYRFSYRMAAKEIAEKVTMRVVTSAGEALPMVYDQNGNAVEDNTVRYAVTDYCETARRYGDAKVMALTNALQNYGAYAWTFFEPAGITQPEVTAESSISGVSGLDTYRPTVTGSIVGLTLSGLFLDLESETNLRLYMTAEDGFDMSTLTITCGQSTLTPAAYQNGWDVKITNIPAKDLDTKYTVTITRGEQSVSVTFCALSYAYSVLANPSGETNYSALSNTVKALYVYNQAANAYFE